MNMPSEGERNVNSSNGNEFKSYSEVIRLKERVNSLEGVLLEEMRKMSGKMDRIEEELKRFTLNYEARISRLETQNEQYVKRSACEISKRNMEARVSKVEDELHNLKSRIDAIDTGKQWNLTLLVSITSLILTLLLIFDLLMRWRGA